MTGVFDNEVFPYFAYYATVVVLKMFAVVLWISMNRLSRQVFANPEDAKGLQIGSKQVVPTTNPNVERIRRCHLNDLENVIPFVLIGFLYVSTGPALSTALLHFRIFTGARIFHTIAYLLPLPQPSRVLGFVVGLLATVSMAVSVLAAAKF